MKQKAILPSATIAVATPFWAAPLVVCCARAELSVDDELSFELPDALPVDEAPASELSVVN